MMPFVDLNSQYQRLKPLIASRIQDVIDRADFIMGAEVAALEDRLAAFCGAGHAVGVASGTDALLAALIAEGVGRGDAVLVPALTFTATAEVVVLLGATPVFVDIEPAGCTLDPAALARRLETLPQGLRPRVVIAVDLYGMPADYDAIGAVAARFGCLVLADAAQSFGATYRGRAVGTLAPVTATSFFPAKPLGCYGDGGALLTDDDERARLYRSIRAHGRGDHKYDIVRVGLNARLDTLQAAVLLAKLTVFEDELATRDRLAARYQRALTPLVASGLSLPPQPAGGRSTWAQYSIRHHRRDAIAARLRDRGIPTGVYYPAPMHLQPAYRHFGDGPGSLPVAETVARTTLSLPIHAYLPEDAVDRVAATVAEAIAGG